MGAIEIDGLESFARSGLPTKQFGGLTGVTPHRPPLQLSGV
jgi:hypothetical protein